MTITSSGLLAIVFGITVALILFIIAGIWACFEVIEHFTEEDDKFEYRVYEFKSLDIKLLNHLGKHGWELVSFVNDLAFFKCKIKNQ